jgi:N utilization substance protein A
VAKVVVREKEHVMEVVVPDDQLSLAIGKKGQNVRLAAQLVGWNIDVMSETHVEDVSKAAKQKMVEILGVDDGTASIFYNHTYRSVEDIAKTDRDVFISLPGMNKEFLGSAHDKATAYVCAQAGIRAAEARLVAESPQVASEESGG